MWRLAIKNGGIYAHMIRRKTGTWAQLLHKQGNLVPRNRFSQNQKAPLQECVSRGTKASAATRALKKRPANAERELKT